MTEEKPEEAKPQPIQKDISADVGKMVAAFKLSETATGYTEGNTETPSNIVSGSGAQPNPTLSRFIKIAEKQVIKESQQLIIDKARGLIDIELDKIKELLK